MHKIIIHVRKLCAIVNTEKANLWIYFYFYFLKIHFMRFNENPIEILHLYTSNNCI